MHAVDVDVRQHWGAVKLDFVFNSKVFMQLVELFGGTRDEWMKEDIAGWLRMNRFYPGAPQLLQHTIDEHDTYIVTTKQVWAR